MATSPFCHKYIVFILSVQLFYCFGDYVPVVSSRINKNGSKSLPSFPYSPHNQKSENDFTFWQFKRMSNMENNNGGSGWNDWPVDYHRYPPPHPLPPTVSMSYRPYPSSTQRTFDKKPKKFRLPEFATIFRKHKFFPKRQRPGPGPSQQPMKSPHEESIPSFISYGPIYGPPPMQHQSGQSQNQHEVQGPTYYSMPPSYSSQEATSPPHYAAPAPSLTYFTSTLAPTPNRNQYGPPNYQPPQHPTQMTPTYGTNKPTTRNFNYPPPTYGPAVQIPQRPRQQEQQQWNQAPTRYTPQNQGSWNPLPSNPPPPAQNQWNNGPSTQRKQVSNYLSPTYIPPRAGGYATPSQPQGQYAPTSQAPQYGVPIRSYEPPMHFGQPMHNFGPPMSSYGQPPPIIGDPPRDRYAPKGDIYRYPTGDENNGQTPPNNQGNAYNEDIYKYPTASDNTGHSPPNNNNQRNAYQEDIYKYPTGNDNSGYNSANSHRIQPPEDIYRYPNGDENNRNPPKHRYDNHGAESSRERLEGTPSRDHYPAPSSKSKNTNKGTKPSYYTDSYHTHPTKHSYSQANEPVSQYAKNARPPPQYNVDYNSPGLSKDPKIVDWMPYSAKQYHEVPTKKKKAPKYRTLPERPHEHQPDPEHANYPSLTYDSISKRMSGPSRIEKARPITKKSELESKTEKEFKEMLQKHSKLLGIR